MTAFAAFRPGELTPLPRPRSLDGCTICHAEVPLSPRYGLCALHAEQELYDLATRKDLRRYRHWEAQSVGEWAVTVYAVALGMLALLVRREWVS